MKLQEILNLILIYQAIPVYGEQVISKDGGMISVLGDNFIIGNNSTL